MMDRRTLIGGALAATGPQAVAATPSPSWPPRETVRLWPGVPPGTTRLPRPILTDNGGQHRDFQLRGVAEPMLGVFRPRRTTGAALLVIPGGGYEFLAVSREGVDIANVFTALGHTVFVLSYRLPAEGWSNRADVPLEDVQRAIRIIRAGAHGYGIDPSRVAVIGFSAGGHVAASLATGYDERPVPIGDAIDRQPARPDALALMYAVTTLRFPETHSGSRRNLLGPDPTPQAVDRRSPVLYVDQRTPPSFLVHALDDDIVSPQCSLEWLAACREHRVPVEAHLLERGGHGFGVGLPTRSPGALWPDLFDRWLSARRS